MLIISHEHIKSATKVKNQNKGMSAKFYVRIYTDNENFYRIPYTTEKGADGLLERIAECLKTKTPLTIA